MGQTAGTPHEDGEENKKPLPPATRKLVPALKLGGRRRQPRRHAEAVQCPQLKRELQTKLDDPRRAETKYSRTCADALRGLVVIGGAVYCARRTR